MGTAMPLSAYLKLVAERIEVAENNTQPREALRLIEILRDELADQAKKRFVTLSGG